MISTTVGYAFIQEKLSCIFPRPHFPGRLQLPIVCSLPGRRRRSFSCTPTFVVIVTFAVTFLSPLRRCRRENEKLFLLLRENAVVIEGNYVIEE